jgi:hypothetical protein
VHSGILGAIFTGQADEVLEVGRVEVPRTDLGMREADPDWLVAGEGFLNELMNALSAPLHHSHVEHIRDVAPRVVVAVYLVITDATRAVFLEKANHGACGQAAMKILP